RVAPGLPAALIERELPGASREGERVRPPPGAAREGECALDDDRLCACVLEGEAENGADGSVVETQVRHDGDGLARRAVAAPQPQARTLPVRHALRRTRRPGGRTAYHACLIHTLLCARRELQQRPPGDPTTDSGRVHKHELPV